MFNYFSWLHLYEMEVKVKKKLIYTKYQKKGIDHSNFFWGAVAPLPLSLPSPVDV